MTPMKRAAGLYAYSLVSAVTAEDGGAPGFVVHRLVQDFARRAMSDERRAQALREALEWVNRAFVGDPEDVRSWPVLDPLAPHALAVARHADAAGIAEPTARLFNQLGILFKAKADYARPNRLCAARLRSTRGATARIIPRWRSASTISRNCFRSTNRLVEAEPLMRRALAIDETGYGPDHSSVAIRVANLAGLLRE